MAGVCPECGEQAMLRQVGRCVYASPCGHRYQGRLPDAVPLRSVFQAVQRRMARYRTEVDSVTGLKRVVRNDA